MCARESSEARNRGAKPAAARNPRLQLVDLSPLGRGDAGSDEDIWELIDEFRRYCRVYYSATQCEAAVACILEQGGARYLRQLIGMEDSKMFFLALHAIVRRGEYGKLNDNSAA